jgi:hypothetical protein
MDYYDIWVDLRDGREDLAFAAAVQAWLGDLQRRGMVEGFALSRRKLGFGPRELGEFHIRIATRDLAQLERAFQHAATRGPEAEPLHSAVYRRVTGFTAALYRDFPDPVRAR